MHDAQIFTFGWFVFAAMVGVFLFATFVRKLPIGVGLLLGAITGGLVTGNGIPIRHLIEGAFTYFDPILIIFTAILFMRIIHDNGALGALAEIILYRFSGKPALLLSVMVLFIMFPAMLTGITTTSVLTTGALLAPTFIALGIPLVSTGAMIALVSVMGAVAPPICLLAMLIGQGVDMPYIGLEGPLALLAFPMAYLAAFTIGYPHLRKAHAEANVERTKPDYSWKLFLPLWIVFILMASVRLFSKFIPDIGIPLIFMIGSAVALFTGKAVSFRSASYKAAMSGMPVLGLLAGMGAFLQVMTLTGVRGLLVVTVLAMPVAIKYIGMAISLPGFGGISAFASAMVFGIPFFLSLLGTNEIVVCSGIAMLAAMGDIIPPSAIEARFAAQVVGTDKFMPIVKKSLPMMGVIVLYALLVIHFADKLSFLVPR